MQKLHIHICTQVRCHYPHQVFASSAIKGSAEYDSCHAQAKMWHWFDKTMRQAWRKARWTCMFVIHFVSHEPSQDSERCRFPWEPRCLLFRLAKIKWLRLTTNCQFWLCELSIYCAWCTNLKIMKWDPLICTFYWPCPQSKQGVGWWKIGWGIYCRSAPPKKFGPVAPSQWRHRVTGVFVQQSSTRDRHCPLPY